MPKLNQNHKMMTQKWKKKQIQLWDWSQVILQNMFLTPTKCQTERFKLWQKGRGGRTVPLTGNSWCFDLTTGILQGLTRVVHAGQMWLWPVPLLKQAFNGWVCVMWGDIYSTAVPPGSSSRHGSTCQTDKISLCRVELGSPMWDR